MTVIAPPAPAFPAAWPRLGMGCAPLGNIFATFSEAQSQETFAAAWDAGVRFFDTAPWYGHGLSEARLGTALRSWPRAEAILSTKVGRVYRPAARGKDERIQWQGGLNFALTFDYTADGVEAAYQQSLLRLGTPAVEALIIHDLDRGYQGAAYDGHLRALTDSGLARLHAMKAAGLISAVGMGINALSDFTELSPWIDVDFFLVAMPYTLLDQTALHGPLADCLRRGIGVVIGAPFASGLLTNPSAPGLTYGYAPATDAIRAKAMAIEAECLVHGVPLMAAALQFPLLHPAVASVIPGAVTAGQARQNAANAAHPIPGELWKSLQDKGLVDPEAPTGR